MGARAALDEQQNRCSLGISEQNEQRQVSGKQLSFRQHWSGWEGATEGEAWEAAPKVKQVWGEDAELGQKDTQKL